MMSTVKLISLNFVLNSCLIFAVFLTTFSFIIGTTWAIETDSGQQQQPYSYFKKRNNRDLAKFFVSKCERIKVEHCMGIGYNFTRYPNFAGDDSETSASENFVTFDPLISVKCSEQLKFFLCSVYFPMCTEKVPIAIGPCRPLCESVRDSCISVLKEFGFPWPASLNCSKFVEANNQDQMCMPGPTPYGGEYRNDDNGVDDTEESIMTYNKIHDHSNTKNVKHVEQNSIRNRIDNNNMISLMGNEQELDYAEKLSKFVSPGQKCLLPSLVYINRTAQCVPLCNSARGYNHVQLDRFKTLLLFTSIISSVMSAICVILRITVDNVNRTKNKRKEYFNQTKMFLSQNAPPNALSGDKPTDAISSGENILKNINKGKEAKYFEKCLFYCVICFTASITLQIVSIFQKEKIACTEYNLQTIFLIAGGVMEHVPCVLMATLIYFFSTAARLWWLMISATMYFCNSEYKNEQYSRVDKKNVMTFNVHLVVWAIPLALCTLSLMSRAIQPEPVSALCLVGGTNRMHYRIFILARDITVALVSFVMLLSFLCASSNSKYRALHKDNGKSRCNDGELEFSDNINARQNKQQNTCFPIVAHSGKGFVSAVYPVLTIVLLGIQLYEYIHNSPVKRTSKIFVGENDAIKWNVAIIYKLFADSILGMLISMMYLLYFLHSYCLRRYYSLEDESHYININSNSENCYNANKNGTLAKTYYQSSFAVNSSSCQPLLMPLPKKSTVVTSATTTTPAFCPFTGTTTTTTMVVNNSSGTIGVPPPPPPPNSTSIAGSNSNATQSSSLPPPPSLPPFMPPAAPTQSLLR